MSTGSLHKFLFSLGYCLGPVTRPAICQMQNSVQQGKITDVKTILERHILLRTRQLDLSCSLRGTCATDSARHEDASVTTASVDQTGHEGTRKA